MDVFKKDLILIFCHMWGLCPTMLFKVNLVSSEVGMFFLAKIYLYVCSQGFAELSV